MNMTSNLDSNGERMTFAFDKSSAHATGLRAGATPSTRIPS
jgi:hypothetical protein